MFHIHLYIYNALVCFRFCHYLRNFHQWKDFRLFASLEGRRSKLLWKSQSIYPTLLDNTLHFLQCRIWRIYWDFWNDFILLWSIVNSSCLIVEFSKTNYCKAFFALCTSYLEDSLRDWNEIRVFCLFCQRGCIILRLKGFRYD